MWSLICLTFLAISVRALQFSVSNNGGVELLSPDALASFRREVLHRHNEYRSKHGSMDLVLDDGLSQFAQQWAEVLAKGGRQVHRTNRPSIGENLYRTTNPLNGSKPVDLWYNEVERYDFLQPGTSKRTGHFTQVVWKKSQKLGIGVAKKGSQQFVVANYVPRGNIRGAYRENVQPLQ